MKESLEQKKQEVVAATEKFKNSAAIVAFKNNGLTVAEFQSIRRQMREAGCEVEVLRNNISRRAAKELGYNEFADAYKGTVVTITSKEDVVAPAKVIFKAAKDIVFEDGKTSKIEIVCGVVDGELYSFDQLKTLSQLPSRETLLTKLAAGMIGTLSQLAIGLNMIAEKNEGAAEAAQA